MSKHTVTGFVHCNTDDWSGKVSYSIWPFDMSKSCEDRPLVGEQSFEVEVPDDFNPVPAQIAALEEKKRQLRVKLSDELARLDERISKLSCIEHTVDA